MLEVFHQQHVKICNKDYVIKEYTAGESWRWLLAVNLVNPQCVDATNLMDEVGVTDSRGADLVAVPRLAAAIISHTLQGHCFSKRNLPSPAFFTEYIFQSLNRTSNLQIIGWFMKRLFIVILGRQSEKFRIFWNLNWTSVFVNNTVHRLHRNLRQSLLDVVSVPQWWCHSP